jgi:hypothetical protein
MADHMTQVKAAPNSFANLWPMWALNNPLNPSRKPKVLLGNLQQGMVGGGKLSKVPTNHPFAFMYNNPGGPAAPPTPPAEISDTLLVEAATAVALDTDTKQKKKRKLK